MSMSSPVPLLVSQRSIRRSPFHEATLRDGCRGYAVASYTISDRCYYPAGLSDPEEEYWKLINDAVLFDPPVERPIEISGPDAVTFVDHLMTRDMTRFAVGQCRYVILCDQRGRLLLDYVYQRISSGCPGILAGFVVMPLVLAWRWMFS